MDIQNHKKELDFDENTREGIWRDNSADQIGEDPEKVTLQMKLHPTIFAISFSEYFTCILPQFRFHQSY